jgi:hypothetical protein
VVVLQTTVKEVPSTDSDVFRQHSSNTTLHFDSRLKNSATVTNNLSQKFFSSGTKFDTRLDALNKLNTTYLYSLDGSVVKDKHCCYLLSDAERLPCQTTHKPNLPTARSDWNC